MRRPLTLMLALLALVTAPAAGAATPQRLWILNAQADPLAPVRNTVISMATDGSDARSIGFAVDVSSMTGWRDSLYIGTSAGILRTDLDGVGISSVPDCALPSAMAVDPAAPALYAVCPGFDITSVPLFRFPLGADGSLGDGTRVQTLANRADAVFVQGGHLYLAETYPNPIGIARMPLGDPTALQEPWYGAVQVRAMAATASTLFFATNGPTVVSARRTPLAAPDWQSAAPLPDVAHPHIAALAVRGQTLYSATGHGMSDTTSVNRQSLATLAVPTVLASWTDSVNHRQVMPRAIYPGEQVQEWYADPTARAVAAGAFAAPLRPSSGLVPTLASATPLVCTVTGVVVTPLAAGTCTITGEQAGNAAYLSAPMGSVSLELTTPPAPTPQGVAATKARVVGDAITSSVTIPGPGTISQTGAVRAARAGGITVVCATRTTAKRAGTVRLTCRLNRAGLRRRAAAPLSVTLTTVYRPTGGAAQTSTQRVRVPKATRG